MRAAGATRPGRGFSLVELMAVLAVLALTTGLVVWGAARRTPGAAGPGLWAALAAADARARARAEATGEALVVRIDLDGQTLAWAAAGGPDVGAGARVAAPRGWRFTGCWTDDVGWVARGVTELPLSAAGASPTFGLRLTAARDAARSTAWVAGETGQWVLRPGAGPWPADEGGPGGGSTAQR